MACMHKKTFKIYHNDQNVVPEDYVEIDELIAPTIQALNQKGYTTKFCCSGHPSRVWLMLDEGGYYETSSPLDSSIVFENNITLPFLPPDFEAEEREWYHGRLVIRKRYPIDDDNNVQYFERAEKILETMKQLYQWALNLPVFDGEKPNTEAPETEAEVDFLDAIPEVWDFCSRKITELGLNMELINSEYNNDGTKINITFVSEDSIDIRELMIALANEFQIKVELRQQKRKEIAQC